MPIQFSCDHCSGTLSIARRKAYSLIDCPKCGCKQVVPSETKAQARARRQENQLAAVGVQSARAASAVSNSSGDHGKALKDLPLFERPDFENLLQPGAKKGTEKSRETKPITAVESIATPTTAAIPTITAAVELVKDRNQIVLQRWQIVLAAVLVLVLIALSFGVGFMMAKVMK